MADRNKRPDLVWHGSFPSGNGEQKWQCMKMRMSAWLVLGGTGSAFTWPPNTAKFKWPKSELSNFCSLLPKPTSWLHFPFPVVASTQRNSVIQRKKKNLRVILSSFFICYSSNHNICQSTSKIYPGDVSFCLHCYHFSTSNRRLSQWLF